jgi:hypothetical protein
MQVDAIREVLGLGGGLPAHGGRAVPQHVSLEELLPVPRDRAQGHLQVSHAGVMHRQTEDQVEETNVCPFGPVEQDQVTFQAGCGAVRDGLVHFDHDVAELLVPRVRVYWSNVTFVQMSQMRRH